MGLGEEVSLLAHVVLSGLVLADWGICFQDGTLMAGRGCIYHLVAQLALGSSSRGPLHVVCFSRPGRVLWTSVPRDRAMRKL